MKQNIIQQFRKEELEYWLGTSGDARRVAAEQAANLLLETYRRHWPSQVPINIYRLAATLNAKIVMDIDMNTDALLMPSARGFRLLVKKRCYLSRKRSAVAHELAHTLFYDCQTEGCPQRLINKSIREEAFCFDVARILLAPRWLLKKVGIFRNKKSRTIFNKLTSSFILSKPIAARVMLADYSLAIGVAGRWIKNEQSWKLEKSSSAATPFLTIEQRALMREIALKYLLEGTLPRKPFHLSAEREPSGDGTFIVVTR